MDLKGLGYGSNTWKGFSDQELHAIKENPATSARVQVRSCGETSSSDTPSDSEKLTSHDHSCPPDTVHARPHEEDLPTEACIVDGHKEPTSTETCGVHAHEELTETCGVHAHEELTETCGVHAHEELTETCGQLDELLKKQKEIEEQNKQRKMVLEKTLTKRYAESQQESNKLERVTFELKKLDQLVTRDVSILRDRIEEATRDFSQARMRFELAEKEFVSAKMSLHISSERKELLSEHLCAVIQQNENRKANKLSELMKELNISEPSICDH